MSRSFWLLLFGIAFLSVLPSIWMPHGLAPNLDSILLGPSKINWLGTDGAGRDIFAQILLGTRLSLIIGFVVVCICLFMGTLIGFVSGYFSGWVDRLFLFVSDIFQAFPGVLLAIAIAAFLPPHPINLIFVLSIAGWVGYARLIRAQTLELKSREFITAARSLGVPLPRILFFHFLPNMAGPLVVQASFGMAGVILTESTLSFLGLGLPAETPSLGKLMDSGVNLLLIAPQVSIFPGAVIMLLVLYFNIMGDRMRKKWARGNNS